MMKNKNLSIILAALVVLPGCQTLFNGENQATTVAERHPITVDQQTYTVAIPVDPTARGLSRQDVAKLDQLLTAYRIRGEGPVTVTAPSGTNADLEAQQTAAEVRSSLNMLGLDYAQMRGSTYRVSGQPEAILVTFAQYVASGPVCGVFTGEARNNLLNRPAPNFGCADQKNFAAMVANPRDLTTMTPEADSNAALAGAAVRGVTPGAGADEGGQ